MLDNDFPQVFTPLIQNALTARGLAIPVLQAYQPTKQGVRTAPAIYYFKFSDVNFSPSADLINYNSQLDILQNTQLQYVESTYQFMALSIQSPNDINAPTAGDLVNFAAMALQSSLAIQTFNAYNVGILRVTDIRNPPFNDDKNNFEFSPNFDISFIHRRELITTQPSVDRIDAEIYRV